MLPTHAYSGLLMGVVGSNKTDGLVDQNRPSAVSRMISGMRQALACMDVTAAPCAKALSPRFHANALKLVSVRTNS